MSVVAKVILPEREEYLSVYAKGSPEMMLTVMDKSTVPNNYFEILKEYTSNGYRVLAIASKKL
jgi:cation-transporting ATPase 13A2